MFIIPFNKRESGILRVNACQLFTQAISELDNFISRVCRRLVTSGGQTDDTIYR